MNLQEEWYGLSGWLGSGTGQIGNGGAVSTVMNQQGEAMTDEADRKAFDEYQQQTFGDGWQFRTATQSRWQLWQAALAYARQRRTAMTREELARKTANEIIGPAHPNSRMPQIQEGKRERAYCIILKLLEDIEEKEHERELGGQR